MSDATETGAAVIYIDDDVDLLAAQTQSLELAKFQVRAFTNGPEALRQITAEFEGAVITDVRMPHMDGLAVFKRIREIDDEIPVIIMTGHGDVQMAVQAIKDGAYDFISKPFAMAEVLASLRRAIQKRELVLENRRLRQLQAEQDPIRNLLLGDSRVMTQLRHTVARVASAGVDVLLTGATGVGKDNVARAIHKMSQRKNRPLIHINCAALNDHAFHDELFGVDPGNKPGMTPVKSRTVGLIERANRGTLLLDDVDGLPLAQQAKLLRTLESREVWPLGADSARPLDIRVIATTRLDLQQLVQTGAFRSDLFYRMSGVAVRVPSLTERPEDIRLLFQRFLIKACADLAVPVPRLTLAAADYLKQHDWPGNVRELEQFAQRYALDLDDARAPGFADGDAPGAGLAECVSRYEAELICETLAHTQGSAKRAMEFLKLPRKTFYDKIHRFGIRLEDYRARPET
jgi:two-component system C4-dicarboxylate transport response regulator DctD